MKRNRKGQFVKGSGGSRRRRRRRNPAPAPAARASNPRRRRRSSSSSPTRRRRRRNPEGGGSGRGFQPDKSYNYKDLIPYMLASLAQAGIVRRFGDQWGASVLSGGALQTSAYRGQAWTLKNYILAVATGWLGAKIIARTGMLGGTNAAKVFWRAGVENIAQRLLWTEGMARWGWGAQHFGQMPPAGTPGQVYDDQQGNRWLAAQNGQWVSMQGYGGGYGELVQAGPLGYGELVQAGPLGYGELVQAGPLGYHADTSGGFAPLGHLLDPSTSQQRNEHAQQLRAGSRDPYAAALFSNG